MVHQSNAYFERCHAADFDTAVRPEVRRQCWARWLQHYTSGQPPDRVDYARHRLAALEDGESIEPLPGMRRVTVGSSYTASFFALEGNGGEQEPAVEDPQAADAAAVDGEQAVEVGPASEGGPAPEGSSVLEGTEDTVELPAATRRALDPRPVAPPTPRRVHELPAPPSTAGACASVCTPRWNECMTRCTDQPRSCREACVTEHRTCMRGCY